MVSAGLKTYFENTLISCGLSSLNVRKEITLLSGNGKNSSSILKNISELSDITFN